MSCKPKLFIEVRNAEKFKKMGIPPELNSNWDGVIKCSGGCPKCRGTRPGCKTSENEKIRREIMDIIGENGLKYSQYYKMNICALFFIFRTGHNHFRPYGSKIPIMSKTQAKLMDFQLKQGEIVDLHKKICEVNWQLLKLVPILLRGLSFQGLTLSKEQYKLICEWMEDDFPVLPMCIRKKMLMTSLALGFLVKRIVGPLQFLRVRMFHSIFKQTLVRKKNFPFRSLSFFWFNNPLREADFLDVFFEKPSLFRCRW
jgi:hypothetical protein